MKIPLFPPRVLDGQKTEKTHKIEKSDSNAQNRRKSMISEVITGQVF